MSFLITDPDDPRIEAYRAIRERDLVGRHQRFVIEGEVVLRVAARQPTLSIESVLLSENRIDALRDVVDTLPVECAVYIAGRAVMDAIVGFPMHRGILAVAARPVLPSPAALLATLPAQALVVGLIGIANHDNVGGIFRNAAAFGADAVLLDPTSCDPLYRKAIRVSVGGVLVVPFARSPSATQMADHLTSAGFEILSLSPSGREPLSSLRRGEKTALLLGAEGPGLPDAILSRSRTISIPMRGGFDSLNVATTSGIALHHLAGAAGNGDPLAVS
ncbi:TrmH family RNA methyltransferase [Microvirga antarctica]|uniref:TrmH family RNA methyltransferase n=1 Tax=Microvirga antarctica TaxID=2819233 RepID=UPI001B31651C|nr:RNA methyltransferase [Microvirga antarctica]